MDRIRALAEQVGGWWAGVQFRYDEAPRTDPKLEPMRFCEAVARSRTRQITLTPKAVECPGAGRSFGWTSGSDADLVATMAEKSSMAPGLVECLVSDTPRLRATPTAITVGECDEPEVALSFIQAEAAMSILRRWESRRGEALRAELPSVMAACGNVAVKAYLTGRVCLSFGCPDSRTYGVIGRDRLILGLPVRLVGELA